MKNIVNYLIQLGENNNREWFNENKALYTDAKQIFSKYVTQLLEQIGEFDKNVLSCKAEECIFRIYRDTRFGHDKTPYKDHFGAYMAVGGRKSQRAGYYIHIQPDGQSFAGGGIHMPQADQLKAIRQEIYYNYPEFKELTQSKDFVRCFGGISDFGRLKKAPLGFPKDWEGIEILKNKSFVVGKNFQDESFENPDVLNDVMDAFKILHPFNDFLNRVSVD